MLPVAPQVTRAYLTPEINQTKTEADDAHGQFVSPEGTIRLGAQEGAAFCPYLHTGIPNNPL